MTKRPAIENVNVRWRHGGLWLAGCDHEGSRYHLSFDVEKFLATGDYHAALSRSSDTTATLYKNAIESRPNARAIYCNPEARANQPLVDELFRQVRERGLIELERKRIADEAAAEAARVAEERRVARIKEFGPLLLATLKEVRAHGGLLPPHIITEIETAIADAEFTPKDQRP